MIHREGVGYFPPCKVIRNHCLWHLESCALESRVQLKKSGIPQTIGIRTLESSSRYPDRINSVYGIQNPELTWGVAEIVMQNIEEQALAT